jgi:hypothetical protein
METLFCALPDRFGEISSRRSTASTHSSSLAQRKPVSDDIFSRMPSIAAAITGVPDMSASISVPAFTGRRVRLGRFHDLSDYPIVILERIDNCRAIRLN